MNCIDVLCTSNYIKETPVQDDPNKNKPITNSQIKYLNKLLAHSSYKLCNGVVLANISKYHADLLIKVLDGTMKHNRITAKYIYKYK